MYSNMKSVKSRSSVNLETAKTEFRRKTRFEDGTSIKKRCIPFLLQVLSLNVSANTFSRLAFIKKYNKKNVCVTTHFYFEVAQQMPFTKERMVALDLNE